MLKINNTITVELLVEEINYGQLQIPSNAAIISYKMREGVTQFTYFKVDDQMTQTPSIRKRGVT